MLKNKKPDKMLKFKNKPGQNRIASVIILLKKILTKIIYYTKSNINILKSKFSKAKSK